VSDGQLILVAGLLMAAGLAAAKVADRARVPGLLLFLGLGMLAGSEGIGGVEFDDAELTRTLGTIGLVLILFEGGMTAGWREIRPVVGAAVSLAFVGTLATAVIAGLFAAWVFDLDLLGGLIVGSAVAASDSAAIFAVLRGSSLRRRLARTLEGESGLNDPIAVLLVVGFIDWLKLPDYGIADMAVELAIKLSIGLAGGLLAGFAARAAFRRLDLPSPGLYPVASLATAALAFGVAEVAHGSGFLSVYVAALILGTGSIPARGSTIAFHQGMSWIAQISLFFILGLLVFPSGLGDVVLEGLALSAVLIFLARPLAAVIATALSPFDLKERLMLGWAGLRGAVPIWLATFPVIAGVQSSEVIFNAVFFVVVTSTLVQGASFNPLAVRLGLTTDEPAVPPTVVETGTVRRLGGDAFTYVVKPEDAAAGALVRDLRLPREALVNLIVRDGAALLPRGSTEIAAGDERATWRTDPRAAAAPSRPAGLHGPSPDGERRRSGLPGGDRGRPGRGTSSGAPRRSGFARRFGRRPLRGPRCGPRRRRRPRADGRVGGSARTPPRPVPSREGLVGRGGGSPQYACATPRRPGGGRCPGASARGGRLRPASRYSAPAASAIAR
jgi:potassium/hydrogen antiporter